MQAGKKRKKFKIQKSKKDANPKIQMHTLVYIYKRQSLRSKSKSKINFGGGVETPPFIFTFN